MLDQRYYSFNMLGDAAKGDKGNQKITSGTQGHNYDSYKYGFTVDSGYKEDGSKITATVNWDCIRQIGEDIILVDFRNEKLLETYCFRWLKSQSIVSTAPGKRAGSVNSGRSSRTTQRKSTLARIGTSFCETCPPPNT